MVPGLPCLFALMKGSAMAEDLAYELDGLAADVFSLVEGDTELESLTGAHGATELAASCSCISGGNGSCVSF